MCIKIGVFDIMLFLYISNIMIIYNITYAGDIYSTLKNRNFKAFFFCLVSKPFFYVCTAHAADSNLYHS